MVKTNAKVEAPPGRLVLQDEGASTVRLFVYVSGERDPAAVVVVRRSVLGLYALDLLRASLRGM